MSRVVILSKADVAARLNVADAIPWVEDAFAALHRGESTLFPAVREAIAEHDGIFGVKSGYLHSQGMIGLKAGGYWLHNAQRGETNHQSVMLLFDPATGIPVCLLDANWLTGVRTGAAGAVAIRHLARRSAAVLGLIGAGAQAYSQALGAAAVRPLRRIVLCDRRPEAAGALAQRLQAELGISCAVAPSPEAVCAEAEIITTVTPSTSPVLQAAWIRPGTHINAFGADTRGKQELDTRILAGGALLVVDDLAQCTVMGETQHLPGDPAAYVHATLGQVVTGERPGRTDEAQVTVFDATGVSVQDLIVARMLYGQACERPDISVVEL